MDGRIFPHGPEGQAPREFGERQNALQAITIHLDNAQTLREFDIGGTILWAQEASSITARMDVRFQDQFQGPLTVTRGFFCRGVKYSRIYVSHAAQAGEWIKVVYATEDIDKIQIENPSLNINEVVVLTWEKVATGAYGAVATGAAQVQIVAANVNRKAITLRNNSATITYIGLDNAVAVASGMQLNEGDTLTLDRYTGAIHGITAGAAGDIRYIQEGV